MSDEINLTDIDKIIDVARAKFRTMVAADPSLFGGAGNARIAATISPDAPRGTIGVPSGVDIRSTQGLMAAVDLTLLDKKASSDELANIAQRAKRESAASVCVFPEHVQIIQSITEGSPPPIAVVGFPSVSDPASAIETTVQETRDAIRQGAKEIDMVLAMNFKDGNPDYKAHYDYMRQVVMEAGKSNVAVKVILETAYLTDDQKVEACMLAKMAGAAFVKTSTGFAIEALMRPEIPKTQKGATPHDVALMRRTVGDSTVSDDGHVVPMGVKASGGVRNRQQAEALCKAGASRMGASGSIDVRTEREKLLAQREASAVVAMAGGRGIY